MDGTRLSAHQVDALSGTLIALTAELLGPRERQHGRRAGRGAALRRGEIEGDELDDEEPLDWDRAEEAEEEAAADAAPRTRAPAAASGSSTPPAPARPWPRSASWRPRAPAAS